MDTAQFVSKRLNLYDDFLNCQFTDFSCSSLSALIAHSDQVCFLQFANLLTDIRLTKT